MQDNRESPILMKIDRNEKIVVLSTLLLICYNSNAQQKKYGMKPKKKKRTTSMVDQRSLWHVHSLGYLLISWTT